MRFPKLTSTTLALLIAAVADVRGGVGNDDLFTGRDAARADRKNKLTGCEVVTRR